MLGRESFYGGEVLNVAILAVIPLKPQFLKSRIRNLGFKQCEQGNVLLLLFEVGTGNFPLLNNLSYVRINRLTVLVSHCTILPFQCLDRPLGCNHFIDLPTLVVYLARGDLLFFDFLVDHPDIAVLDQGVFADSSLLDGVFEIRVFGLKILRFAFVVRDSSSSS